MCSKLPEPRKGSANRELHTSRSTNKRNQTPRLCDSFNHRELGIEIDINISLCSVAFAGRFILFPAVFAVGEVSDQLFARPVAILSYPTIQPIHPSTHPSIFASISPAVDAYLAVLRDCEPRLNSNWCHPYPSLPGYNDTNKPRSPQPSPLHRCLFPNRRRLN
ncbi:hypothetical protein BDD12DRAFT_363671 [Trichophaea hybrida]|nr:hypothetical protein BDD12DRAFT_363671 [Trichophaea hybrida]